MPSVDFSSWLGQDAFFEKEENMIKRLLSIAVLQCLQTMISPASAITLSACGDVMMKNRLTNSMSDQTLMNYLSAPSPIFKSSHIAFVNLEGPIGGSEPKRCSSNQCYTFSQSELTPKALRQVGVNVVSLANNHTNDMGSSGQKQTLEALDQVGIQSAGLFERPVSYFQIEQQKIGLIAFTSNSFAPDLRATVQVRNQIQAVAKKADIVIVSAHMGAEGAGKERFSEGVETYLGENRGNPVAFARMAIDAGASVVLGHGPHVPRALDFYKGRMIAYSLGNCATGPGISTSGTAGLSPVLTMALGQKGELQAWQIESFVQTPQGLRVDPDSKVKRLMLFLTKERMSAEEFSQFQALQAQPH